jgi:hypothetical protein
MKERLVGLALDYTGDEIGGCTPLAAYRTVRKGYDLEDAARAAVARVLGHTQLSYERLMTLYQQVAYIERRRLPGALVECGVWRGGAAAVMAQANLDEGRERRLLHLFDSFEGMPEPRRDRDGPEAARLVAHAAGGALRSTGVNVASAQQARTLIVDCIGYPASSVVLHPGWFQHTLPHARAHVGPIALLRVDGDWYDSTRVVLDMLYDLVTPGGVVVIDDYGHFEGCRRATDEFLAARAPNIYLHHIDYTGRYLIKP